MPSYKEQNNYQTKQKIIKMKKNLLSLLFVAIWLFQPYMSSAQNLEGQVALSTEQAAAVFAEHLSDSENGTSFDNLSDHEFWSILIQMDSIMEVVYKPRSIKEKVMDMPEDYNFGTRQFTDARNNVNSLINNAVATNRNSAFDIEDYIIYEDEDQPYLLIKTSEYEVVSALRNDPDIEYVGFYGAEVESSNSENSDAVLSGIQKERDSRSQNEMESSSDNTTNRMNPLSGYFFAALLEGLFFTLEELDLSEGNGYWGCSDNTMYPNNEVIEGYDYFFDTDEEGNQTSMRSWHFDLMNIDVANEVTAGAGAKVAILETGINSDQNNLSEPVFSQVFPSRSLVTSNSMDGGSLEDNCGHGTRMTSNLAAPAIPGYMRGVAYEADLVHFKSHRNVILLKTSEFRGVKNALRQIRKGKDEFAGIDVVSMSIGYLWQNWAIQRELTLMTQKGIVPFAAIGTTPLLQILFEKVLIRSVHPDSEQYAELLSKIMIAKAVQVYPAVLPQTIGVTGVYEDYETNLQTATSAHYGLFVDFVVPIQKRTENPFEVRLLPCLSYDGSDVIEYTGGSSIATSTMAGIGTLIKSVHPDWGFAKIKEELKNAAHLDDRSLSFGWGVVDVSKIPGLEPQVEQPQVFSVTITGPEVIQTGLGLPSTYNTTLSNTSSGNLTYSWSMAQPNGVSLPLDCFENDSPTFECLISSSQPDNPNLPSGFKLIVTVVNSVTGEVAVDEKSITINSDGDGQY